MEEKVTINSVEQLFHMTQLATSGHPLFGVARMERDRVFEMPENQEINLYVISCTRCKNDARYGWRSYDYSTGSVNFYAPGQTYSYNGQQDSRDIEGWIVAFHPDFISRFPLGEKIQRYKFFSYNVNEALYISDREKELLAGVIDNMIEESNGTMDDFSQTIIISHLNVLLSYAQRFYARQFCTRASVEEDRVIQISDIIDQHLHDNTMKMVTPQLVADKLNMSTHYLSDLLRKTVGLNTQQVIHNILIDKAKLMLRTSDMTVNEIAYHLGFEYPQYFSRLFKNKTGMTPSAFKVS